MEEGEELFLYGITSALKKNGDFTSFPHLHGHLLKGNIFHEGRKEAALDT